MKKYKTFPGFKKHLKHFIMLSIAVFITMLFLSTLPIIFDDFATLLDFELPKIIYYLGVFISIMMLIMGVYYLRALKSFKLK